MPKYRNLDEQFKNPIVHMDRDGNGYCRIQEIWDQQNVTTYSSWDEYEAAMKENNELTYNKTMTYPSATPNYKTGMWSDWEREQVKRYIHEGIPIEEMARRLNRSVNGVRNVVKRKAV